MRQNVRDVSLNSEMLRLFILIELLVLISSCSPCGNNDPDVSDNLIYISSYSINSTNKLIFEFDYENNILEEIKIDGILASKPSNDFLIYQNLDSLFYYNFSNASSTLVFVNFDEFVVIDPILVPSNNKILFHNEVGQLFAVDFNGNIEQLTFLVNQKTKKSISPNGKLISFFDNTSKLIFIDSDFTLVNSIDIDADSIINEKVIWSDDLVNLSYQKNEFTTFCSYDVNGKNSEFSLRNVNLNYPILFDNKVIYFDNFQIMQLDADGRNNKMILEFNHLINYADIEFNSATKQLLLTTNSINDSKDLYLIDFNEDNPKEVLLSNNSLKAKWRINE